MEEMEQPGCWSGAQTGGVTASEMRRRTSPSWLRSISVACSTQSVDTRLRDLLELRETHPATFVHVMSLFEERDATIRDLDQQIAERRATGNGAATPRLGPVEAQPQVSQMRQPRRPGRTAYISWI